MADLGRLGSQLTIQEGYRLHPYTDAKGKITIGVGRNLTDRGISPSEAQLMLSNDMDAALMECALLPWYGLLDHVRQNVILNLVFNMGMPHFLGFKNTIDYIKRGMYREAAKEMLDSDWARRDVAASRSQELSKMMETGEWP